MRNRRVAGWLFLIFFDFLLFGFVVHVVICGDGSWFLVWGYVSGYWSYV